MKRSVAIWAVSLLLTAVLMALLLREIPPGSIVDGFRYTDPVLLSGAFLLHTAAYAARTLRYGALLGNVGIGFRRLFAVHAVQNMFSQLLPAGVGEVSFPLMVKRLSGIRLSESGAAVVWARLSDIGVLLVLFAVCTLLTPLPFIPAGAVRMAPWAIAAGLVLSIVIGYGNRRYGITLRIPFLAEKGRAGKGVHRVFSSFAAFTAPGIMIRTAGVSLLSNAAVILTHWALLRCAGVAVTPYQAAVATALLIPVYVLPLRGVAGFGTLEGGWTLVLMLVGVSKADSISGSFALHIYSLCFILALAGMGGVYLWLDRRKR